MASKRNKDTLKRREEKRRRKTVARKEQIRDGRLSGTRNSGSSDLLLENLSPPKLSAVIWAYADPLLHAAEEISEKEKAVTLSIFCWNASLLPSEEGHQQIEPAIDKVAKGDKDIKQHLFGLYEMMQARKQQYFAHDRRFILDYQLTRTTDSLHLQVISTPLMRQRRGAPVMVPEPNSVPLRRVWQQA